jgi:hypothetical protein
MFELGDLAFRAACVAEDVYFWRDGNVKALKRRNAPLEIPDWLKDRECDCTGNIVGCNKERCEACGAPLKLIDFETGEVVAA